MRRFPQLNSLRAFEAAGRWLSFSKAAEELHVTPAAVSQQIRQLEDYLGVTLFHRMTRAVRLTEEARAALPLMTEGFDRLAEAVERLAVTQETGLLTINTAPTFAATWLLQRLPDFSEKYPDIDLRLDASLVPRDFEREGIDISIRLSQGDYPGLYQARIFGEEFSPVCSPELLAGDKPLLVPADLKQHRLLHIDWGELHEAVPDWLMWFKAMGVNDIKSIPGPRFTIESMAIEAAIRGNGIALVSHHAVAEDLKAGRLVKPFDLAMPVDYSYWMICPHEYLRRAKVKAFCDWVLEQAADDSLAAVRD
jgi:LysR family glycine cleavage system transcriptional activator